MTIQLIGAGYPRTGTTSLKLVLEKLLGKPCYHMHELMERQDDNPIWEAAAYGNFPDWPKFLNDYGATVDWPSSLFWESQAKAFPEAPILLSTRKDSETWYNSVAKTIVPATQIQKTGRGAVWPAPYLKKVWEYLTSITRIKTQ